MKKYLIFPIVLIQCFFTVSGQVTFDKGYIIDNSGIKTECLIKNYDWWSNPKAIQYKLPEESAVVLAPVDSIMEFKVDNYPRFVRATVKIDRSPIDIRSLSNTRIPLWSEETLFLRELTCGKACLWIYTEDRSWFFYSIDGSIPEQLIYKEYTLEGKDGIYKNTGFRQQLSVYLQNENTKDVNLKNLKYQQEPLVAYFKQYNSDFERNTKPDIKKSKHEAFNVKITGSLNYSKLCIQNPTISRRYDFGGKTNWMGGLELEYFFPYCRNKLSILLSPTFEHYNQSKIFYDNRPLNVNMITVHFPIGVRYGFYLNNNMKIYLNVYTNQAYFYINKNDGFTYYASKYPVDISESGSFILGGGFAYKKWQIGLEYHTSRDLFYDDLEWKADYTKVALSVSYKFLIVKK